MFKLICANASNFTRGRHLVSSTHYLSLLTHDRLCIIVISRIASKLRLWSFCDKNFERLLLCCRFCFASHRFALLVVSFNHDNCHRWLLKLELQKLTSSCDDQASVKIRSATRCHTKATRKWFNISNNLIINFYVFLNETRLTQTESQNEHTTNFQPNLREKLFILGSSFVLFFFEIFSVFTLFLWMKSLRGEPEIFVVASPKRFRKKTKFCHSISFVVL